ncbi:Tn3 family transposase [Nocardia sp. NPDC049190]|uniref:Tn3 family transposase n=1 Tax=Nocardia sp. NPDC049190 TaxID=3155650 RepID=UPI0033E8042C
MQSARRRLGVFVFRGSVTRSSSGSCRSAAQLSAQSSHSASLLVGKLSASGRQNALAAALKEYGAMRRTIYAAKYLSDPRTIGGASPASSTRANPCTPCAGTCCTRTRA